MSIRVKSIVVATFEIMLHLKLPSRMVVDNLVTEGCAAGSRKKRRKAMSTLLRARSRVGVWV